MRIPQDLVHALVEHARAEAPNVCCGFITAKDGVATRLYPARNVRASPLSFEIADREQLRIFNEIDDNEDADGPLAGLYHSHTRTAAYPSQTDINFAADWPGVEWLIVGLGGEEPEIRSFLIEDGRVREVGVEVE